MSAEPAHGDWETRCQERDDGQHCNCWYDGRPCCACGDDGGPADGVEVPADED